MEVANVQALQSVSKPQSKGEVKSELFSQLLFDAIDTDAPATLSEEKDEETSSRLMEMMMGMLNFNLLQENVSEPNISDDVLVEQTGVVDLEGIMMAGVLNTEVENVSVADINNGIESDFVLPTDVIGTESNGDEAAILSKDINLNGLPMESLENSEDMLQNTVELQESTYHQNLSLDKLNITNDIGSLDVEETFNEGEVAKEVKTDEKNGPEKVLDLNLMDNVQLRSFENIANEVEVKDVKLSEDNIQRVNDSIIQLVETTTEGEANVIKVKLYPEELGTVDVTLKMEEGKLTAKILVDNEQVKGMFSKSINELNESLLKQNIQVKKIDIDLNLNTSSNNMNQGFDFNQHRNFNQGANQMRNYNLRSYYSNVESVTSSETDIHKTGELSILA